MAEISEYSRVTPAIERLAQVCLANSQINRDDYVRYNVKRGLRDLDGTGVLAGLTEISEIISSKTVNGEQQPCPGELYYRGYSIQQLTSGFLNDGRFGFEETAYLLMFGQLPDAAQLEQFNRQLAFYRSLPTNFVRDVILKAPSPDMMNTLARCVLTMASYDERPDDISLPNVIRQCIDMIAIFPLIAVYGYQAYNYYLNGKSLYIHTPRPELSTAENILTLLRPDGQYTPLEARILDLCLVLHAEHGGGNNSTFTTHVVTSSGTDTYSCMAAALASLKGPRHGGANIKVVRMFEDMEATLTDWEDEDAIKDYLAGLLAGERFDKSGLIYGMGHAVYSVSDPRAQILRSFVERLSDEKGLHKEYALYAAVERLAPQVIAEKRRIYKGVSANVDFYSGFVYRMLGLPTELFTPLFAMGRVAGWSAHRMEELINMGKIIRPAYMAVQPRREYVPLEKRT
ncbi:citrate synthase [Gemmiger sp. An87]|uniref:Citrate synthase n=1 Tax=Allofournierella massiliensis TaxID=1650663 RepID=A0ABT7UQ25_9FIRM|nr:MULTISPECIES: citrate/2-methylcitrate synthase [Fournierella]MDM8201000.1 citrate/2-methylcitrate synthase [Fournierella massiliensis]OUN17480.1 citrate synthase [Gemmiger sp. An87]